MKRDLRRAAGNRRQRAKKRVNFCTSSAACNLHRPLAHAKACFFGVQAASRVFAFVYKRAADASRRLRVHNPYSGDSENKPLGIVAANVVSEGKISQRKRVFFSANFRRDERALALALFKLPLAMMADQHFVVVARQQSVLRRIFAPAARSPAQSKQFSLASAARSPRSPPPPPSAHLAGGRPSERVVDAADGGRRAARALQAAD